MRRIELDIRNIATRDALHIYLQYMLELPAYYGRNLDALNDLLSTESEEREITLHAQGCASEEMLAYLPKLKRAMQDAAQENPRVRIVMK